ncbi:unnamed protein product [Moneuplotes crassus]|uniref:Bromo domain-containing protein n=1 Tax=Euplotes crassus TaxID=5936 RepID=A0AAD1X5F4_EUPCR|nr:unnamed protein product [Moneuplotes crassus]
MAAFDVDDYMESIYQRDSIKKIKMKHVKVPTLDIDTIIQVKVLYKGIIDKFIDWDFEDTSLRPIEVATDLVDSLDIQDNNKRLEVIDSITESISEQLTRYLEDSVEQQASIARRKKITPSTIACPECDSIFQPDDENCIQCGFVLKKKNETKFIPKHYENIKIIGDNDSLEFTSRPSRTERQFRIQQKKLEKKTRSRIHKTKDYLTDDKYSCQLWSRIIKDPLINNCEGLEDMISKEDASCLRSLYTRLKEIFCNDPEYRFELDDQQIRDIHYLLDKTYEDLLTDNPITDEIFRQPYTNEDPLAWKNVLEETHNPDPKVQRFRPYNMESHVFRNISHNQLILSNMDAENDDNIPLQTLLDSNQKLSAYLMEKDQVQPRRKGRPKKHDYYTEPIVRIGDLNTLVKILREQAQIQDPSLRSIRERVSIKKISKEENKDPQKCTKCMRISKTKLLVCENCPVVYHPSCMGYEGNFPRRKWKCYFCKIIKYGLKCNLTKIAPAESQWCKSLLGMIKSDWKEIALKLMEVISEYPASKSFWYTEKRDKREYQQKQTYPMNMAKIKKNLEYDIDSSKLPKTAQNTESSLKYEKLDDFLADLLTVFRNTQLFIDPNKMKYKYSEACQKFVMYLLQEEDIFQTQKQPEKRINKRESFTVAEIQESKSEEISDLEEREKQMNEKLGSDEDDYNIVLEDNSSDENKE